MKTHCAIIGSGNIGTDLMVKIMRTSKVLELKAFVGIDPNSDGLKRADSWGIPITAEGVNGLVKMKEWDDIKIIFDATSAKAHVFDYELIKKFPDKKMVDLTPAAIGPYVIPCVNLDDMPKDIDNINMVTCGGQATIPMVAAVSKVAKVHYGEIVASIASKSAGPGTRANIDEFTETTAKAIEGVGKAQRGKAIIILNPAEPPLIMRDTIYTLSDKVDTKLIEKSVREMAEKVQKYVPGYKLKNIIFDEITPEDGVNIEGVNVHSGIKTSIFIEVKGAGHYLPPYAGNLDIMTSAALAAGEVLVSR